VPIKWQEVTVVLSIVFALVVGKYVPFVNQLPLARVTGIVCFSYAIFLSLRLLQADDAVRLGEWTELRPSLLEKSGALFMAVFSAMIVYAMLFVDRGHTASQQMLFYVTLAVIFGAGALAVLASSIFTKVRWNQHHIEHRSSFGKRTTIAWHDVAGVTTEWRGITIHTAQGAKVRFSPFQAGATQLARRAEHTARRNAAAASVDRAS